MKISTFHILDICNTLYALVVCRVTQTRSAKHCRRSCLRPRRGIIAVGANFSNEALSQLYSTQRAFETSRGLSRKVEAPSCLAAPRDRVSQFVTCYLLVRTFASAKIARDLSYDCRRVSRSAILFAGLTDSPSCCKVGLRRKVQHKKVLLL